MRFLDSAQRESIGFNDILEGIATVSKLGEHIKRALQPYTKNRSEELQRELTNTQTMLTLLKEKKELITEIQYALHKVKDILPTLKKIGKDVALDELELFEIKLFSKVCTDLSVLYKKLGENLHFVGFEPVEEVFEMLDPEQTGYETFYIYEGFSPELKSLRESRKALETAIQSQKDWDAKNELLLQRADILNKEEKVEYSIRQSLTERLIPFVELLTKNGQTIGYIDFLIAKSVFFLKSNAIMPTIAQKDEPIVFQALYNPFYEKMLNLKGGEMQRIDIQIKSGVTLLTGANMGGKSIAMKTVALNTLLANCGLYVYAKSAQVPIIDFLYLITEDLQSVEKGLSTFGAEMIALKTIIGASGKKNGLIVLDELAKGTNPQEARIIINAVVKLFDERKSYTFISTHFDGIHLQGVTHLQVVGISRVNFEQLRNYAKINSKEALNILQKNMDYSIEEIDGTDVPHNALQIANLLGLDMLDFDKV